MRVINVTVSTSTSDQLRAAMIAIIVNLDPVIQLRDEQFYQLCQVNRDIRLECTAKGELIVMSPTGGETGDRNSDNLQLRVWNKQSKPGKTFDSSTGFSLPQGTDHSPDAAWVKLDPWENLAPEQRQTFPPLCPDFVVELRSASDELTLLQSKMHEYLDNGLRLG